jgi:hypothetical protein
MMPKGERPQPQRSFGRRGCSHDAADHDAAGEHVEWLENKRETHGFAKKERPMESLTKIIKDAGFIAVAKAMTDEGRTYGINEHEFTEFATEHAQRLYPDKTPAAAFAAAFTDGSADGLTLRRAHRVVRDEQLGSTYAKAADRGSNSAYGELLAKAAELRKVRPELREAQAFAKVFSDPANSALATRERIESATR